MKTLAPANNPNELDGVDERGGSLANTRIAVIESGKVKERALREFK